MNEKLIEYIEKAKEKINTNTTTDIGAEGERNLIELLMRLCGEEVPNEEYWEVLVIETGL